MSIFKTLVIAFGVLGAAFFYRPPAVMEREMEQAMAGAPIWHIEIEGEQLHVDIVKKSEQGLVRISYPPLKLINNQWITLEHNSPQPPLTLRGGGDNNPPLKSDASVGLRPRRASEIRGGAGGVMSHDLFYYLRLTRRLTTLRDILARQERYTFVFDNEMKESFFGAIPDGGELIMDARTGLPMELSAAQMHASVIYSDPLANQTVHARPLEDVLAQLREVAEAQNGKPKKITPLAQNRDDTSAFSHDFDRDGLSDALEIFYGTDMANSDTDNDTFLDGDEVERGFSPIGAGRLN